MFLAVLAQRELASCESSLYLYYTCGNTHYNQNLSKEDDVRKYVVRRELPTKEGKKKKTKAPKIQRLVTPRRLQHRRQLRAEIKHRAEKNKADRAAYAQMLAQKTKEEKEKRQHSISQKRSQRMSEKKEAETKK